MFRELGTAQAAELSALDTQGLRLERAETPRTDPVRSSARVGLVLRSLATKSEPFVLRRPGRSVSRYVVPPGEEATEDTKGPKTHMRAAKL